MAISQENFENLQDGQTFKIGKDRYKLSLHRYHSGYTIRAVYLLGGLGYSQGNVQRVTNKAVHMIEYLMGKQIKYSIPLSNIEICEA